MSSGPRITRSNSTLSLDFAAEFRTFVSDSANRDLLREILLPSLQGELEDLRTQLKAKDEEIDSLKSELRHAQDKDDELEQYTRRNSLRITGIPEERNEDCYDKVLQLANTNLQLNPPLTLSDIDRTHRVGRGRSGRPRALLVKFATYRQRHRVMHARKLLNRTQFYINEDLTRKRSVLSWHARQAKKGGRIKDTWTTDGRVMVKENNDNIRQITNILQLPDPDQAPPPVPQPNTQPMVHVSTHAQHTAEVQTQSGTPPAHWAPAATHPPPYLTLFHLEHYCIFLYFFSSSFFSLFSFLSFSLSIL